MRQVVRRIRVEGRVQGVGFRHWTRSEAEALGLAGWVRNEADGSVLVLAAGPEARVDELIAELDRTANELGRARSDLVREAVERYLESLKEIQLALERPERLDDRVVDIDVIKRHLAG